MKNGKITLFMTLAVLAGFGVILLMNVASMLGLVPYKYISPNDVRGMAIEHNKTLYTLNFQQQNALVEIFNRSTPITKETVNTQKSKLDSDLNVQRIIIYRFNQPDIEIKPIGYVDRPLTSSQKSATGKSLVYSAPLWNKEGYLEESANDDIRSILSKSYE